MSHLWAGPHAHHKGCPVGTGAFARHHPLCSLPHRQPFSKPHSALHTAKRQRCAVCSGSLEPVGFPSQPAALAASRSNRSLTPPRAAATATAAPVLEPPASVESVDEPASMSIFPARDSTTDLFDMETLQHQVSRFMSKCERRQGAQLSTPDLVWRDSTFSANDQQRLEESRQKHIEDLRLQESETVDASVEASELDAVTSQSDSAGISALSAEDVRRREEEAKALADRVAAAHAAESKASAMRSSGAEAAQPSTLQQRQRRRTRAAAARTAELRTGLNAAWGKSSDGGEHSATHRRSRAQRQETRASKNSKSSKRNEQPFQIMFRNQNQLAHKLLTMEEEQLHAKVIVECRPYDEKLAELQEELGRPPSMTEWAAACEIEDYPAFKDLVKRARAARGVFEQCNMRLVAKIAYKYIDRGLELEDLMSYGMSGLSRAIDRFEPSRGFKFSTYAHWWIRQVISRAVCDKGRTIRIPCHLHDLRSKAFKRMQSLASELMREPTTAELAASLNVAERKIEQLGRVFKASASLEAPMKGQGDDEGTVLIETLAVNQQPDETPAHAAVREALDASLSTLDARERVVVRMRYGLDDGCPRTLEDIGKYFKVTRERVRQIEGKAFRKMSQPGRLNLQEPGIAY